MSILAEANVDNHEDHMSRVAQHPRQRDLFIEDIINPFSAKRFAESRWPLQVGDLTPAAPQDLPSCLDMLVKMPKGDMVLPMPYCGVDRVTEFLEKSFAFEDELLPGWRDTHYAYLTVDQRIVRPQTTHRSGGWHFDGMQGSRYPVKINACHQYVSTDFLPTEYTNQPTDATGLDENKHNWFSSLGNQVEETSDVMSFGVNKIVVMSAYQLHRSPVYTGTEEHLRTFMRLDISLKQQDRLGNTINPDLPAPWEFQERSLPTGLSEARPRLGWTGGHKFS